jgi:hypothetical protein
VPLLMGELVAVWRTLARRMGDLPPHDPRLDTYRELERRLQETYQRLGQVYPRSKADTDLIAALIAEAGRLDVTAPVEAVPLDIDGLLVCLACQRRFAPDEEVVMAVPFREQRERLQMGQELLLHEACPFPVGLREVGRGRHQDILDGVRRAYHPHAVVPDPV